MNAGHKLRTLPTLATVSMLLILLTSCVPTPTAPTGSADPLVPGGVFVVCEGLWTQDNSALSYLSPNGNVVKDVVSAYNPGVKLGDTSTDILVKGDTLFVVVSKSHSICVIRKSDGMWLGRTTMPNNREPYHVALSKSGKLFCTNINDDSMTELDAATLAVVVDRVVVGPAPEGIACADAKVYIANSGYGDLRKNEKGSGTLSVLSEFDLSTVAVIEDLPNVALVASDAQRHRVWVTYRHYASEPDSLGGLVLINSRTDTVVARWKMKVPTRIAVDDATGDAYVLCEDGVQRVDGQTLTTQRIIEHATGSGSDIWYSIGFDPSKHNILIGNARSYVTDGEVIVVDKDGTILGRYNVSINPSAFAF